MGAKNDLAKTLRRARLDDRLALEALRERLAKVEKPSDKRMIEAKIARLIIVQNTSRQNT